MKIESAIKNLVSNDMYNIEFEDVFNLADIQHLQDLFSDASGVSSIITHPDGRPITNPSNFCRLCDEIIRKSKKGHDYCFQSNEMIDQYSHSETVIRCCMGGGMWHAGASIIVGGRHIANWLIGQTRNELLDEAVLLNYAEEIGVEKDDFLSAFKEVPIMPSEQFTKVAKMLFAFVNELSEKGYNNLQLKQQIDERDKAIEELQINKEKYRVIYENVLDVFYTADMQGTILEISPSVKIAAGYDPEELIGTSVYNLYQNPDEREVLMRALLKNGKLGDYEIKLKSKSGKIIYTSVNVRIIKAKEDSRPLIFGSLRNITERKQIEVRLKEQTNAMEAAIDGLAILDANQNFVYMNKSYASIHGYGNAQELIGGIWHILYDIEELKRFGHEITPEIRQKGFYQGRAIGKKKNGCSFPQALSLTSLENGGMICTVRDITDQMIAEKELIDAKEKAEESDRLKTAFLNNISHEIRTPFNGILGFLSLILDEDLPAEEKEEYIGIINQSADRLMNTINDIVEISQIQAGQIKLRAEATNLYLLIGELSNLFKKDVKSHGLEFDCYSSITENTPDIFTDPAKLKTIISILINNAVKFTTKGSVKFNADIKGNQLEFSIQDTGQGISLNKQHDIFERFNQAEDYNTRQFEGLGLGLSIAKSYTEMLGGKIWVESEPGVGSTFHIQIPFFNDVIPSN